MANDGTIKLGYDGKQVEAGFSALESRSRKSAASVEGHFKSLSSRVGGHFKNLGAGITQGIGQGLWSTIAAGANAAGQQMAGVNLTELADSAVNANQILDALLDRATKLGTSAESLQRLELFGKINGKSADEMVDSLARLNRSLADVGENKKAREAFSEIGIDVEAFAKLEPDQQLLQLATAFQKAEKDGQGLAEIYDILGKSGGGMLQVLRQSTADLDALAGAKVIPEEVVLRASEIADELTRAADAKNKQVLSSRTGLQLSEEESARLKEQAAERAKAQQAIRDANAQQIGGDVVAADDAAGARDKEKEASRARALQDLQAELAIMDQRARGHEKQAAALEKEQRIIQATRDLVEGTGLAEDKARQAATAKVNLEDKINENASQPEGGRRKIRGYSGAQRDARPKTIFDASFKEFFENKPLENGATPRNRLSGFNVGGFIDAASGRRSPKNAAAAAAAVNGGNAKVQLAEARDLLDVNRNILSELKRLSSE